jgi:hypothetical protein
MQSEDFVAVLELTDENLINELDRLEEIKSNKESRIGNFDYLNKKLHLTIVDDVYKVKMEKIKRCKQNLVLEIDNSEYLDYTDYVDHLANYKKNNRNRRLDEEKLKGIIKRQKEEHAKRVQESRKTNMYRNLTLGKESPMSN